MEEEAAEAKAARRIASMSRRQTSEIARDGATVKAATEWTLRGRATKKEVPADGAANFSNCRSVDGSDRNLHVRLC